ncbi:MAG: metallophosphoesterase [Treponema sp.]|nr:metallophosphoesterase [Candidatus Treponema scatequi]
MNTDSDNEQVVLKKIKALSKAKKIVSKKELFSLLKETTELLQNEITSYRKEVAEIDGMPGSLLDFTKSKKLDLIVVPDLHARKELIYRLLTYSPEANAKTDKDDGRANSTKTIFEMLCEGKLRIVFLGDILHSETLQKERWYKAFEEYEKGNAVSQAMTDEMTDGLSTLCQVLILKKAFPESVHCLKGNHENIKNECANGNFAFHKFVYEGDMVLDFMVEHYGVKSVELISQFENHLPLAAFFENVITSHAEPKREFSKSEINSSVLDPDVVYGLTWTKNDEAEENSALDMLKKNCVKNKIEKKYITGHRAVRGLYNLRADGKVVQIHNPVQMQAAYVKDGKEFNPDEDIFRFD